MGFVWALLALVLHVLPGPLPPAQAQGTRKDDIVFNSRGVPLAGATVRVCAQPASAPPCTPLAPIYSDPALTQALGNPTTSDGLGNYYFYAAPGKYTIEISGPSIATKQIPDVVIPLDPSNANFSGNISAFSLSLSGNLTVNGNTSVIGNLASGTLTMNNQSTPPGAASAGTVSLYTKSADKRLYYKDETGAESGPLGAGAATDATNTFTAPQNLDADLRTKGPNPYADISRFGKFTTFSNTTANTTSGQPTVALASAQSFKNGEYVTVYNAGAPSAISPMGAVTLTPALNAGGLNTVAANAGATSFGYKVVAADKWGGYTAAGAEASTTTGNALGMQTIAIASMSRSGRVVTVTTSAAHPFVAGAQIFIKPFGGNADVTFNGFYIVTTVADTTHFTFNSGMDTAAGATSSDTGGTVIGFTCNRLSWSAVTGAWKYYIYGRASGGPWTLLGQTMLPYFNDYGSPLNDNQTFPAYVPASAPSSGANDHLTAQITAGGGTTTLTLASNAGATLTGAGIVSDDGPAWVAAASSANAVYIPSSGSTISSYTVLPGRGAKYYLGGGVTLRDTLEDDGGNSFQSWSSSSPGAFSWEGTPCLLGTLAYPVIAMRGSPHSFRHTCLASNMNNASLVLYDFGSTNVSIDYSSLQTNTLGNPYDYLGMHGLFQGCGFSFRFDKDLFITGSPGTNAESNIGFSPTPTMVFTNQNGQINCPTGNWAVTHSWFVARSSFDQDYVSNSGGINWMIAQDIQTQNSFLPPFMITGASNQSFNFDFENITPADFPTPVLVNLRSPAFDQSGLYARQWSCLQGGNMASNGLFKQSIATNVCNLGQNRDVIAGPSFTNQSILVNNTGGMGYQISAPAAPSAALSGASGPAANTYFYQIMAYDAFGGNSLLSPQSNTITVNGSQGVLVTWTPVPGQVSTTICRGALGGGVACQSVSPGFKVSGNSFLDNGTFFPNSSGPSAATGFANGLGSAGMEGTSLVLTNGGFSDTLSGTFTANRTQTLPDLTGVIPVTGYSNSAYDNANRANGAIGANWTVTNNGINVSSNNFIGTASTNDVAYWSANSFSAPQFSQVTITALNGVTDFPGVAILLSGSGAATHGYNCIENTTTIFIQRITGATNGTLTSAASTGAPGDILRLESDGAGNLACYKNDVSTLTTTDTTYTAGAPGLFLFGTVATEKNWSGGNLHPLNQLDIEADYTKVQHMNAGIAMGLETFTASPRAEQNIFFPGALTSTWAGSTWTLDKAVTVTRMQVQAKTAPAGCATNAVVRLTDGASPLNLTIAAAANDSGPITQNYAAGASLALAVQTAAAGCATSPADANVTIQYRMQ